ncbi:hypothetical protein ACVC7O_01370 [Roseobacter sp. A03A-229]
MIRSVLHVGAHRTGTTSLQRFLQDNVSVLRAENIEVLCPPESRAAPVPKSVSEKLEQTAAHPDGKLLISEENLLGTMEHNIETETLYPNVAKNLRRLEAVFQPDVVMLSIREFGGFWTSAILFSLCRSGMTFPTAKKLDALCQSSRGWADVIDDIRSVFPEAQIIVREFAHLRDNPKRFLRLSTDWPVWGDTKLNRRAQNVRPGEDDVVSTLLDQGDFNSLSRLGSAPETAVFSQTQREELHTRYQADIEKIWASLGASFLESREAEKQKTISEGVSKSRSKTAPGPKKVLLHISKTGGTFLKTLAEQHADRAKDVYPSSYGDTLISTIKKFGRDRKLAFFFRNPEERFVAGFLARMRQGRPDYDVNWSTGEAVAFSFFDTPDALAEALCSKDERLKSAARFAMSSIFHLKHNYAHFLHSPQAVDYELQSQNILICCETNHVAPQLERITDILGLPLPKSSDRNLSDPKTGLTSAHGKSNLKDFWAKEFEIYAACKTAAQALGFAQ